MVRMDEERPHVSILRISYCESYDLVLDLDNPATTNNLEMLAIVAFGDDREDEAILVYRKTHPMHRGYISGGSLAKHNRSHIAPPMIGTNHMPAVSGTVMNSCPWPQEAMKYWSRPKTW